MTRVRVIALGSPVAGDDAAALRVLDSLTLDVDRIPAGRPGPGLLDLLSPDEPTVLIDVIRAGLDPGSIVTLPLEELIDATISDKQVSSHGFGPSEALRLGKALGRSFPPGQFVGIEGECFETGIGLSDRVRDALPAYGRAVEEAVQRCRASHCAQDLVKIRASPPHN